MRNLASALLLFSLFTAMGACTMDPALEPPPPNGSGMIVPPRRTATEPKTPQPSQHRDQEAATQTNGELPTEILKITVLYDNYSYNPSLRTAWGFAAEVESGDHTLLFDTGGDGSVLLSNMELLGVAPSDFEAVVLSHAHGDHIGGLEELLATGTRPTVFLLPSFPDQFKSSTAQRTEVIEVSPAMALFDDVFTTGEMKGAPPEQALVIRHQEGLVILTGCAHPGVVELVRRAKGQLNEPVQLVMGGFHLRDLATEDLNVLLTGFRQLGVQRVAPCHCTGDRAIAAFREEYKEDCLEAGVGRNILLGPRDETLDR